MRVALAGLTYCRVAFRDHGPECSVVHRQHLPGFSQAGSLRFPHFSAAASSAVITSQPWLQRWASFRSVLLHQGRLYYFRWAVYVPADDLTDPAPVTTFTHLMQLPFFLVPY